MGGNVIYLPKTETFGEALGGGVGTGMANQVSKEMDLEMKRREYQQNMAGLQALQRAGSRQKALEIMVSGAIPFKDAHEMSNASHIVDQMYPPKDTTPHKVDFFNPTTGETGSKYIPQGDLERVDSLVPPGTKVGKPADLEQFYTKNAGGIFQASKRKPIDQRGDGEYTLKEMEVYHKAEADRHASDAAVRSAHAAEQSNKREERNAANQEITTNLSASRTFQANLASALDLKHTVGLDGLVTLDGDNDKKKVDAYRKASAAGLPVVMQYKGDTGRAVQDTLDKIGYTPKESEPPAPPPPKKEEKGFTTKVKEVFTGGPVKEFATEAEAAAAAKKKEIKVGDSIIVNGKPGKWK
jgi:hypothetical protein